MGRRTIWLILWTFGHVIYSFRGLRGRRTELTGDNRALNLPSVSEEQLSKTRDSRKLSVNQKYQRPLLAKKEVLNDIVIAGGLGVGLSMLVSNDLQTITTCGLVSILVSCNDIPTNVKHIGKLIQSFGSSIQPNQRYFLENRNELDYLSEKTKLSNERIPVDFSIIEISSDSEEYFSVQRIDQIRQLELWLEEEKMKIDNYMALEKEKKEAQEKQIKQVRESVTSLTTSFVESLQDFSKKFRSSPISQDPPKVKGETETNLLSPFLNMFNINWSPRRQEKKPSNNRKEAMIRTESQEYKRSLLRDDDDNDDDDVSKFDILSDIQTESHQDLRSKSSVKEITDESPVSHDIHEMNQNCQSAEINDIREEHLLDPSVIAVTVEDSSAFDNFGVEIPVEMKQITNDDHMITSRELKENHDYLFNRVSPPVTATRPATVAAATTTAAPSSSSSSSSSGSVPTSTYSPPVTATRPATVATSSSSGSVPTSTYSPPVTATRPTVAATTTTAAPSSSSSSSGSVPTSTYSPPVTATRPTVAAATASIPSAKTAPLTSNKSISPLNPAAGTNAPPPAPKFPFANPAATLQPTIMYTSMSNDPSFSQSTGVNESIQDQEETLLQNGEVTDFNPESGTVDELEAWRKWGADIDWNRMKLSGSNIYEELQKGKSPEELAELNPSPPQEPTSKSKPSPKGNPRNAATAPIVSKSSPVAASNTKTTPAKLATVPNVPLQTTPRSLDTLEGLDFSKVNKKTPLQKQWERQEKRVYETVVQQRNPDIARQSSMSTPPGKISSASPLDSTKPKATLKDQSTSKANPSATASSYNWRETTAAWRDGYATGSTPSSQQSNKQSGRGGKNSVPVPKVEDKEETLEDIKTRVKQEWVMACVERARMIEQSKVSV